MTEQRANEILRTKYPEARLTSGRRYGNATTSQMVVVFKPNGKVYKYYATTYAQVLEKLGFTILYKHSVEAYKSEIARLEGLINDGGYTDKWFHLDIRYTDAELAEMQAKVDEYKRILETGYIE